MAKRVKKAPAKRCEVVILGQVDEPNFVGNAHSPEDVKRIGKAAEEVRKALGDSLRFTVYSSLDDASIETANALLCNSWVAEHTPRDVAMRTHTLNDDTFETGFSKDPENRFLGQLKAMVDRSIREAAEAQAGMVLVASPAFITEFPKRTGFTYAQPPNIEPLGINRLALQSMVSS